MKLYLANTTKQLQQFHYRLPEVPEALRQPPAQHVTIRIGGQECISEWGGHDLQKYQIDHVIKQIETYGGIDVNAINRINGVDKSSYYNYIYSIDKPIPPEKINRVILLNDNALVGWGRDIRKNAAIADNMLIQKGLENQGLKTGLLQTQISVEEESADSSAFREGFQVTKFNPQELEDARQGSVMTKKGSRRSVTS